MAIQSDPRRSEAVETLRLELERQRVGLDGVGPVVPVWDTEQKGPWTSAKAAWALGLEQPSEHHLVVQDDIIPCSDFIETAAYLATVVPEQPITYFTVRGVIRQALDKGKSWASIRDWLWAQALSMPKHMIEPMLTWIDKREPFPSASSDDRMGQFFRYAGVRVLATAPCLVEHPTDTPETPAHQSLLGHAAGAFGRSRQANVFIGEGGCGMDVDWGAGLDNPERV